MKKGQKKKGQRIKRGNDFDKFHKVNKEGQGF